MIWSINYPSIEAELIFFVVQGEMQKVNNNRSVLGYPGIDDVSELLPVFLFESIFKGCMEEKQW